MNIKRENMIKPTARLLSPDRARRTSDMAGFWSLRRGENRRSVCLNGLSDTIGHYLEKTSGQGIRGLSIFCTGLQTSRRSSLVRGLVEISVMTMGKTAPRNKPTPAIAACKQPVSINKKRPHTLSSTITIRISKLRNSVING